MMKKMSEFKLNIRSRRGGEASKINMGRTDCARPSGEKTGREMHD
jgi:hypothetical protein